MFIWKSLVAKDCNGTIVDWKIGLGGTKVKAGKENREMCICLVGRLYSGRVVIKGTVYQGDYTIGET